MKIPNYFNRLGTFSIIDIPDEILQTPNDLTSNDSNSDFIVSQRTTSGDQEAWKAMDGNLDTSSRTQYSSGIFDWWQIEFKTPVQLQYIYLNCNNQSSKKCFLEYSNDGITWQKLDTTAFNGSGITERQYINLSVVAKYYRVICQVAYYFIQINEIKFKYKKANNVIISSDQYIKFKLNEYNEYQIEYVNTSTNNATFKVIEGQLPEGIYLDQNTGLLHGQPTENISSSFKIRISNKIKYVDIILTIEANNYLVTPHNLTSYSNGYFTVSQNSNADYTRVAWKAMDGSNKDSEGDCSVTGRGYGNWWQIKFNDNVTIKKLIFTARKNTADETETVNSKDLVLQYSSDGSNFHDVVYFEVNLISQAETTVYVQDNNYAQYWRIKDTDTVLTHHLIIGELQFTYEKYQYDITANNQYINFKLNEYNSIPIKYASGSKVSFRIVEGTLPEGISFDEATGTFSGTPTSIGENNLVVEIANTFQNVEVTVKIIISEQNERHPIIVDGLTYFMPFTNSYTIPYLGSYLTIQGEEQPTLENDGKIQGILVPRNTALYDDQGQYWSLPALNGQIPDLSFSFWFKPATLTNGSWQSIFGVGKNISLSEGYAIIIQQNNSNLRLEFAGHYNQTLGTIQLGKWYHICGTISNNLLKIYINNNQIVSRNKGAKMVSVHYICINQNIDQLMPYNNTFFISSLRIYNRALGAEEVTELFQEYIL